MAQCRRFVSLAEYQCFASFWLQGLTSYEVPSKDISTKEFPAEISSTHAGKLASRTSMSRLFLQFPVRTQITFRL